MGLCILRDCHGCVWGYGFGGTSKEYEGRICLHAMLLNEVPMMLAAGFRIQRLPRRARESAATVLQLIGQTA